MNKKEILTKLNNVHEEELTFFTGKEKLINRFDDKVKLDDSLDPISEVAFSVYSLIVNAILFKSEINSESIDKYLTYYKNNFSIIIEQSLTDIKTDLEIEKTKALNMISDFFNNKRNIQIQEMMATFYPLSLLEYLNKDKKIKVKKITTSTEQIFNNVLLYYRSIFHSYLKEIKLITKDTFHPDYDKLTNGIFSCNDKLILPCYKNLFSLQGLKMEVQNKLDTLSNNFPLSKIEKIIIIYLTKDICVEINVK